MWCRVVHYASIGTAVGLDEKVVILRWYSQCNPAEKGKNENGVHGVAALADQLERADNATTLYSIRGPHSEIEDCCTASLDCWAGSEYQTLMGRLGGCPMAVHGWCPRIVANRYEDVHVSSW